MTDYTNSALRAALIEAVSKTGDERQAALDKVQADFPEVSHVAKTTLERKARLIRQERKHSVDEGVAKEREKLREQMTTNERKQLIRRAALVENVVESVREALGVMPTPSYPQLSFGKASGQEETAVLVLSDTHAGKESASYNSDVFAARLRHVGTTVERLVRIHRSDHKVQKLVIIMDGDMVDGEGIYPTQPFHVDQTVLNQIFRVAVPAYLEFLGLMSQLFKSVEVHCVPGNHGRVGKFAAETSNWDTVLYNVLEIATKDNKRITWDITDGWHKFVEVDGTRILVAHGHQIKSVLNIPWYGVTTKIMRWAGSVGPFDIFIMGHYHTRAYADWNDKQFIMNGTMVTDDEFSREVVGMSSSTQQTLFFTHPTKKVTSYHSITLGDVA